MADYRLSTPQRNELYTIAERLGLDPATFDWTEEVGARGDRIHRILHPPTGAFLKIDWFSLYGAGYLLDPWPQLEEMHNASNWGTLRPLIQRWLSAVKAETDAPNLWAIAKQSRAWLTSDVHENAPFTPDERNQIARHLRTIEEYTVKTYQLSEAHQAHVREQLGYLTEAAERVGRFDWKNLAVSTFVNIVVTLGLDIEKIQKLLALVNQLLGPLVAGVARLHLQ